MSLCPPTPPPGGSDQLTRSLLSFCLWVPQSSRREMVGRPWAANENFAVLELASGTAKAILISLDGFFVDQVSDIDEHAASLILAATDFFFQGMEQPIYLDRQGTSLGLSLDRKSTRLNSSHPSISYAVFC